MRILEITGRARQGKTEPFICRASDGWLYYVKGRHAGYRSMVCEWLAGRLAQELDLPIAPFEIVDVPRALIKESLNDEHLQLGVGEAFGSQQIEFAEWFQWEQRTLIPAGLRAQLLVFDWWICNSDRVLGELDGNVNLLWTNSPEKLHLIDHNNAFSREVSSENWSDFCADHVFGQSYNGTTHEAQHLSGPQGAFDVAAIEDTANKALCQQFGAECESAYLKIDNFWDEMPDEWQDNCPTLNEEVKTILQRGEGALWTP